MVEGLEKELDTHRKLIPEKSAKNLVTQNYREKEAYLCYEVRLSYVTRFSWRVSFLLSTRMSAESIA